MYLLSIAYVVSYYFPIHEIILLMPSESEKSCIFQRDLFTKFLFFILFFTWWCFLFVLLSSLNQIHISCPEILKVSISPFIFCIHFRSKREIWFLTLHSNTILCTLVLLVYYLCMQSSDVCTIFLSMHSAVNYSWLKCSLTNW